MRTILSCLTVLALVATFAAATAEERPLGTVRGQVATIDAATGSLVVALDADQGTNTKEMSFFVSGDAKIVRGGDAIRLAELRQGDKVTVTYRSTAERNEVVNIGVEPKKA